MSDSFSTRPDETPPTRAPSTDTVLDSLATRFIPGASDDSTSTRNPVDSLATSVPDASRFREAPPDSFPGYELLETLGEGGMGTVYKARQMGLNRLVALKVILGGRRAGTKDLIRFLAEAEAVASIKHPHVVQVHEYGEVDGRPFLTLEYLPGGTLADRLKDRHRLDPKEAASLVAKLARAVQEAHDQGIVHRDLKPANVLFDAEGEPKVTDFGLAKRAKGNDLTQTQAVMGTPAYMSPEQAQGNTKFVGPPADIYAIGVILYECLAGARPFHDADTHVLLRQVIEDEPKPPTRHVPGLPRDLELIALKCLAKAPADRYSTSAALAGELAHFMAGEPVSVRSAGAIERTLKWARLKPTLAAAYLLGTLAVFLVGLGGAAVWQWRLAERERSVAVSERDAKDSEANAKLQTDRAREALAEVERSRRRDRALTAKERALEQLPDLRRRALWPQALALLAQTKAIVEADHVLLVDERLEAARRDIDLLASPDEIRMRKAAMAAAQPASVWNASGIRDAYRDAFHQAGYKFSRDDPERAVTDVARKLADSAVRDELIASLDDGAWLVRDEFADVIWETTARVKGEGWRTYLRFTSISATDSIPSLETCRSRTSLPPW